MKSRTRAAIWTMLIGVINSFAMVLFNIIYTNLLLKTYGSEVNGLISTITQFVSFFSIIEGGFTTAAVVSTFDTIFKKQFEKLGDILFTIKRMYYIIALVISIFVLLSGTVYVNAINSPFPFWKTYTLLVISMLTTVLTLGGLSKYTVVLQGYNREYISIVITLISKTVTWILSVWLICYNYDILLIFLVNVLNVLINILLITAYEKRYLPEVTYKGRYNRELVKGTGDVFFQKIASTIFNSTDLVLVSACISLSAASVYNLYTLVFKSVSTLLSSVVQAPFNSFGQIIQENDLQKVNKTFEIYLTISILLATTLLSVTGMMIIPFVRLYTWGVEDYNYVYPTLVLLFLGQYFSQIINRPFAIILNASGKFKMQNKQCFWSVVANLVISISFIKWLGMHSIILGSFVATIIILEMNIVQAYKFVLHKSALNTNIILGINFLFSIGCTYSFSLFDISITGYLQWVFVSIGTTITVVIFVLIINFFLNKKAITDMFLYLKNLNLKINK